MCCCFAQVGGVRCNPQNVEYAGRAALSFQEVHCQVGVSLAQIKTDDGTQRGVPLARRTASCVW
ncbi:hypothetical protein M404DRAFT_1005650 [Pisolithus tinctorius Marx 270]|uniref:Uncharacterized protein n=1 Tax=Pisolithus tinctorius Marx 270 TaxID=870435 RepID=A0A0C3NS52_PISTI|nr:hypothetical protein M404DRAFT_1005650 [Pisolithus tinctorius Marx 270]